MKTLIFALMLLVPFVANSNDQNSCKDTAERAQEIMRVRQYTPDYLEPYTEIMLRTPDLAANAQEAMAIIFLMTSMTPVEAAIVDKIRVIKEFAEASYLSCMG